MKTFNSKIGNLVIWFDYVKPKKNPSTGNITYLQSKDKLDGYSQRYIGLYTAHNGDIYIGVALNRDNEQKQNNNWFRFIIDNRITTLYNNGGNMEPDTKGATMVPPSYRELLVDDPCAYNSIYGALNSDDLESALRISMKGKQREVSNKVREFIRNAEEQASECEE